MCEAAGHKQEVESRQEGCVVVWKTNYPHRSHLCHRIVTLFVGFGNLRIWKSRI